ncbi:MAG TPA: P-II family nitrogen regulator [Candidatus Tectomicrobia bacterium]|nr:P-II family nitrogen regulator [Candidatus Tectomicrobia bacterium]
MKKIEAIIRPEKLDDVKHALSENGFIGLNIVGVTGRGVQKGIVHAGRAGQAYSVDMLPKVKLETVVADKDAETVVGIIQKAAATGNIGDGKIFIIPVEEAIRVRTGERGDIAV